MDEVIPEYGVNFVSIGVVKGTVDSLWRNGAEEKSHSAWAAPELTSAITQSAFDFINKTDSIVANEQRHTVFFCFFHFDSIHN